MKDLSGEISYHGLKSVWDRQSQITFTVCWNLQIGSVFYYHLIYLRRYFA